MFETGFVKKNQGTFVKASRSFGKVTAGLVSAPTLWVPCVPPSCWLDVMFGGMFFIEEGCCWNEFVKMMDLISIYICHT